MRPDFESFTFFSVRGKLDDPLDKLVAALEKELGDELVVAGVCGFRILIAVTQSRLIILDKTSPWHAVAVEVIPIGSVTSVDFRPKWLSAELEIHVLSRAIKIKNLAPPDVAKSVADAIRQAGDSARSALSAESTGGSGSGRRSAQEIAEAIRELGTLRDEGLLTDDEFVKQKAALLGEM